jgi:hypothetical protein
MDRKGEESNHLAEINLVPYLCQGEIGPLLLLFIKLFHQRKKQEILLGFHVGYLHLTAAFQFSTMTIGQVLNQSDWLNIHLAY